MDTASTKVCVMLCSNALVSIAYTGIAVAKLQWMDSILAGRLAHRNIDYAMIQPGAAVLVRPIHLIIRELAVNLNGWLNTDCGARESDLKISIVGWHFGHRQLSPLAWSLTRGPIDASGRRFFLPIDHHRIGKFFRQHPAGLWAESLGNPGDTVDNQLRALKQAREFTHDDIERHLVAAIAARAEETPTVGRECLAVQLALTESEWQIQFTYYPSQSPLAAPTFLSGWVLTPTMICSPGTESTFGSQFSDCGNYAIGGFKIPEHNLSVRNRIPTAHMHHGGPAVISYGTQTRKPFQ